jgi:hypothetical protein
VYVKVFVVVQFEQRQEITGGRTTPKVKAVKLGPLHIQSGPQIVEKWIKDETLFYRDDVMCISSEKAQLASRGHTELGMIAIAPRFGGGDDVKDIRILQTAYAPQLVEHDLLFEPDLGFVADVLEVAAAALSGAKVGTGWNHAINRRF